jgi:hypothetical protein
MPPPSHQQPISILEVPMHPLIHSEPLPSPSPRTAKHEKKQMQTPLLTIEGRGLSWSHHVPTCHGTARRPTPVPNLCSNTSSQLLAEHPWPCALGKMNFLACCKQVVSKKNTSPWITLGRGPSISCWINLLRIYLHLDDFSRAARWLYGYMLCRSQFVAWRRSLVC